MSSRPTTEDIAFREFAGADKEKLRDALLGAVEELRTHDYCPDQFGCHADGRTGFSWQVETLPKLSPLGALELSLKRRGCPHLDSPVRRAWRALTHGHLPNNQVHFTRAEAIRVFRRLAALAGRGVHRGGWCISSRAA